jgi:hypothetical protein
MTAKQLRTPTFAESVAIDNYKEATKGALEATDGTGDKIATAAVSAATAYGAVIALVTEKEGAKPLVLALPFVGFGLALIVALWSQSRGVKAAPDDEVDKVQTAVTDLITAKRRFNRAALVILGTGLVVAGFIVADKYRKPAEALQVKPAVVVLTAAGRDAVAALCGGVRSELRGSIDAAKLGDAFVVLKKPARCPRVRGSLGVPAESIALVRLGP